MPKPSDFANADIDALLDQLTHDEAVALIAGVGFWHTAPIPRLGIPQIKVGRRAEHSVGRAADDGVDLQVSDGPNGVRGERFFMGTPAKTMPVRTTAPSPDRAILTRPISARQRWALPGTLR